MLFSSDILPCKYAETKPESGKEYVSLSCHPKKYTKPEEESKKRQMYHELE